jgi:DNA-binding CsgD family transcriptional regulator
LSNFRGKPDWRPLALMRIVFSIGQVLGFVLAYSTVNIDGFGNRLGWTTILCAYILVIAVVLLLSNESNIWTVLKLSIIGPTAHGDDRYSDAQQYQIKLFCTSYGISAREEDVLVRILSGRSVKKISEDLNISEHTVVSHVRHIYQKTSCHSRQELIDLVDRIKSTDD